MNTAAKSGIVVRRSAERGVTDIDWLRSFHSFSFGGYQDPRHMGFRTLRVINEDFIAPAGGFPMHPHRDMEIFSYVVSGALAHKDSMGNEKTIVPGQIQVMSAGRLVTHSEFNPSASEPTHMLQIWLHPRERGLTPSYTEWQPTPERANAQKVLIISADGREDSATIHQDASVYRIRLKAGESATHDLPVGRGVWVQVIKGEASLNGVALSPGDGASSDVAGTYTLQAVSDVEALLFDLI